MADLMIWRLSRMRLPALLGLAGVLPRITGTACGRLNDRGEYRISGISPGKYTLNFGGGKSFVYYPAVTDEFKAGFIELKAEEEMHLGTTTLPPPGVPVSRFVGPLWKRHTRWFRFNSIGLGLTSFRQPADNSVVVPSVIPGEYDTLLSYRVMFGAPRSLLFARRRVAVFSDPMDVDLGKIRPAPRISGGVSLEDAAGNRTEMPFILGGNVRCRLDSDQPSSSLASGPNCLDCQITLGRYRFEMEGAPAGAYLREVIVNSRDGLSGFDIAEEGVYQIDVVLAEPGAIAEGKVLNDDGQPVPDAVVALIPDGQLRPVRAHICT
jgi:hypothetical protein